MAACYLNLTVGFGFFAHNRRIRTCHHQALPCDRDQTPAPCAGAFSSCEEVGCSSVSLALRITTVRMNMQDENEIRNRFPNASQSFIERNRQTESPWESRASFQKPKEDREKRPEREEGPVHRGADKVVDEAGCGRFRVDITLLVSNKRDRDPDGCATTLLDCILDAIGRFARVDRHTLRKVAKSVERQGRR